MVIVHSIGFVKGLAYVAANYTVYMYSYSSQTFSIHSRNVISTVTSV